MIARWVIDFREKGIEGLKSKKRRRPSKMPNTPKKSKYTKVESSAQLTYEEDNSLNEEQQKESTTISSKVITSSKKLFKKI